MTHGILLALTEGEADVVRAIDTPGSGAKVVRRCADLAELLGGVGAGIGTVAVLSSHMPGVDRASVGRITAAGARVLLVGPGPDAGRLAQLGADAVAAESDPAGTVAAMAIALARGETVRGRPGAAAPGAPDGPGGTPVPDVVPEAWTRSVATPTDRGAGDDEALERPPGAADGAPSTGDQDGAGRPTSRRALHRPDAAPRAAPGPPGSAPTPSEEPRPDETAAGDDPPHDGVISEVPWWLSTGAPTTTAPAEATTSTPDDVVDEAAPPVVPPPEEPGRIVVVWGARGAPGRTTVAVNLAAEAAALGTRAVVVDADTEAPALAQVLGLPDDISSIAAVARHAAHGRLDADVARSALAEVADGLTALTGLTRPDRWRELESAALESVWEVLREVAPLVVVDVAAGAEQGDGNDFGPVRHQATLSALAAADEVVVVGSGDPVGVRRLVLALTELRERDLAPGARRTVVVNRVRRASAGPDHERAVREALWRYGGDQEPHLVLDDPGTADGALLAGATWREQAPSGGARRAVESLARHLLALPEGRDARSRWWRRGARVAGAGRG